MSPARGTVSLFDHDDSGYFDWLAVHRSGCVVKCNQKPTPNFLMLHWATRTWIKPPRFQNWTTLGFIKVWASAVADIAAWTLQAPGGTLQPCKTCMWDTPPRRGHATPANRPRAEPTAAEVPDSTNARDENVLFLRRGLRIAAPEVRLLAF